MPDDRYDEDAAARIFRRAAELEQREPPAATTREGLTLAELQDIGREAGLDPALIARVAATPEETGAVTTRRLIGIPVGVGHVVELGRTVTDAEWERIVVDLRETFDARGVMRTEGSLRQWTNGNLQVLVEPVATGHRIRFRTVHGQARTLMTAGLVVGVGSAIVGVLSVVAGGQEVATAFVGAARLVASGAAVFAVGAARLPRWTRRRREQMEAVAERAVARGMAGETDIAVLPPATLP